MENDLGHSRSPAIGSAVEVPVELPLNPAPDVSVLMGVEGNIQKVSASAGSVLGYTPGELVDTPFFRHIYERDLLPVFRGVADLVSEREEEVSLGFRVRTAHGILRVVQASMRMRWEGQAIVGILLTLHPLLSALG